MNKRNNLKIKKHFGREDFIGKAQVRLNALRYNSTEEKKRMMTEPSTAQQKSSCFATEI